MLVAMDAAWCPEPGQKVTVDCRAGGTVTASRWAKTAVVVHRCRCGTTTQYTPVVSVGDVMVQAIRHTCYRHPPND